jgi:hypothetical protein
MLEDASTVLTQDHSDDLTTLLQKISSTNQLDLIHSMAKSYQQSARSNPPIEQYLYSVFNGPLDNHVMFVTILMLMDYSQGC